VLLHALARGLGAAGDDSEIVQLAMPRERARAVELFARADRVWLGFPLYTDAMPGLVMQLIEALEPLAGRPGNPSLGFLVQSGFPEPGQSRPIERWLELLAARLGSPYLGTIVKGGVEGIQSMPPWMTRGLLRKVEVLGRTLGTAGALDRRLLDDLAGPDWLNGWRLPILHASIALGSTPYWNRALRKNGAWERRLDRPYGG
jgi:hypothetical protein